MNIVRVLLAIVPLLSLHGCSGGGGSTPVTSVAWEKFRHDVNNSGGGNGPVADNNGEIKWHTPIDGTAISASPAIDINGTIYVATEGGTLAALNSTTGGINWSVCNCDAPGTGAALSCPSGTLPSLGKLISSPAVYSFNTVNYVFIGSAGGADSPGGAVYMFQDNGTTRTCAARFQPTDSGGEVIPSSFVSSPAFTTNGITRAISGVLIAGTADATQYGTMYALNTDGSLIWQYPELGEGPIGAVTSSPALGSSNAVFFTSADGNLYALANNGTFKWSFPIGTVADPRAPFSASPLTTAVVFAASASGQIFAINPDGSLRWKVPTQVPSGDDKGFVASLAIGDQATTTPTLTPTIPPTPTPPPGASPTPTATITPVFPVTTVFGVTTAGTLVLIDTTTGAMKMIPPPATPIVGPVVASPFTSADQFLVVAAADGKLHNINTLTGQEPTNWPVTLAENPPTRIRSSPSVDNIGVIYVGADNGIVYAVGTP